MCVEEVHEDGLVGAADALEVEDFPEVGVGFVGDVNEVGLDEGFWGMGADLEGFEEGVDFRHCKLGAFNEAGLAVSDDDE